jgi:hypothetical protein
MSTPARSEPDGRRASLSGTKRPLAPVTGNVGVPSPAPEIVLRRQGKVPWAPNCHIYWGFEQLVMRAVGEAVG